MVTMLKPRLSTLPTERVRPLATTVSETQRTRGGKWMRMRHTILRRDNGMCCLCNAELASEVDHRLPLWQGGTDDEANLQAVCSGCHDIKTKAEATSRAQGL